MEGATQRAVLAYVGLAGLLLHLAAACAGLWARAAAHGAGGCRAREYAQWMQAKLRAVQREVVRWRRGQDKDPGYHIAKGHMRSLCVQRARAFFTTLRLVLSVAILWLIWGLSADKEYFTLAQGTVFVFGYFVLLAIQMWPCLLSDSSLDFWYVLVCIAQLTSQWSVDSAERFGVWGRVPAILSLISASFCDKTPLLVMSNLSVALCRAIVHTKVFGADVDALLGSHFHVLFIEIFSSVMIIAIAHQFHALTFVHIYGKVMRGALRQESAAMTRLLELMCDVVLEMDSDLRISQPSPKLAAMLKLGSSLSVLGTKLEDLMPLAPDRANFQKLAEGLLQDEALPSAMHATLRGRCSNLLQVEILYAIFPGVDGAKRFLAGIREVIDAPAPGLWGLDDQRRNQCQGELPPSESSSSQSSGWRKKKGHRGTPRASIHQPLGAAHGGGQDTLADKRFQETNHVGKELSVLHIMEYWNVKVSRSSCCAFHGYLREVSLSCSILARRKCPADWRPTGDAQCQECGVLTDWLEEHGPEGDPGAARDCDVCFARAACRPVAAPHCQIQPL